MERRVFAYRSGAMWLLVGFLWVWAGGWLYGVATTWKNPRVEINERLAAPNEAHAWMWGFLAVGILVLLIALVALLYFLNCRIEVANDSISWYDWRGRIKVRGSAPSAKLREAGSEYVKAYIETDGGEIKVWQGISDYGVLLSLLSRRGSPAIGPYAGYVPPAASYGYRWSTLHVFSFLWLGGVIYFGFKLLDSQGPRVLEALVLTLFSLAGVWMQLTSWVERIEIGPAGIRWIDFLGRTRLQARLDQIVSTDVDDDTDGSGLIHIHTTEGTIRAGSGLQRGRELLVEARRVAGDAERGVEDLSSSRLPPFSH